MAVDLAQVIPPLVRANVDFILIGGMAAILHGSARVTFDVDVVYLQSDNNIERLANSLAPYNPLFCARLRQDFRLPGMLK